MSRHKGIRRFVVAAIIMGMIAGFGIGLWVSDPFRQAVAGLTTDQIMHNVWNQTDDTLNVDPDAAKSFFVENASASANAITVTIAAVAEKKHYVQYVCLFDTAGTGAAEDFYVMDDATKVYDSDFTVGEDKEISLHGAVIVSAAVNKAMEIEASATNLTGGSLLVLGYTK